VIASCVSRLTRLCRKVKGTVVKLAKASAKSDEKRRDTIGVEFDQRGKVGQTWGTRAFPQII
jgi:hypothetical protein